MTGTSLIGPKQHLTGISVDYYCFTWNEIINTLSFLLEVVILGSETRHSLRPKTLTHLLLPTSYMVKSMWMMFKRELRGRMTALVPSWLNEPHPSFDNLRYKTRGEVFYEQIKLCL